MADKILNSKLICARNRPLDKLILFCVNDLLPFPADIAEQKIAEPKTISHQTQGSSSQKVDKIAALSDELFLAARKKCNELQLEDSEG